MNEMQLKQPIEPDELRSLFLVTTESSFSFLWAGGGKAVKVRMQLHRGCNVCHITYPSCCPPPQLMSDFLDITEEHQSDLLAATGPQQSLNKPSSSRRRQIAGAAGKFVNLNAKARDLFRRGVGLNTLADVEQRLTSFLAGNQSGTADLDCADMLTPMQRLVGHAVAEFHGCSSRTTNRPDGSRAM